MSQWDNVGPIDYEKKLKALLHEIDAVSAKWTELRQETRAGPKRILRGIDFLVTAKTPEHVIQRMELVKDKIHALKLSEIPTITITKAM